MRVALMIEGQENVTWDDWVAIAAACEQHGIDALFRSDHYVSFDHPAEWGALDAWMTIAALASRTTRLRLGTCVSPVTFRHPANLAKSIVSADHASGGRVELGMGAGWFDDEFHAFGFPYPDPVQRQGILEEAVEIVWRLWSIDDGPVTFHGRHFRLDNCVSLPQPIQQPHPPLILGGNAGPRGAALAARWADEYNLNNVTPEVTKRRADRLAVACEASGRDPGSLRLSVLLNVIVGSDPADVTARAARLMHRDGEAGDPAQYLAARGPERLTGTPEQVLERMAEYARIGVDRILLQHGLHQDLEPIEMIGQQMVPEAAQWRL